MNVMMNRFGTSAARSGYLSMGLVIGVAVNVFIAFVTARTQSDCFSDCANDAAYTICASSCYTDRGVPMVAIPAGVIGIFLMVVFLGGRYMFGASRPTLARLQDAFMLSLVLAVTLITLAYGSVEVCMGNILDDSTAGQDLSDCQDTYNDTTTLAVALVTLIVSSLLVLAALFGRFDDSAALQTHDSPAVYSKVMLAATASAGMAAFISLWATYSSGQCDPSTRDEAKDCAQSLFSSSATSAFFSFVALALIIVNIIVTKVLQLRGDAIRVLVSDVLLVAALFAAFESLAAQTTQSARLQHCQVQYLEDGTSPSGCSRDAALGQADAVAYSTLTVTINALLAVVVYARCYKKQGNGDEYQNFVEGQPQQQQQQQQQFVQPGYQPTQQPYYSQPPPQQYHAAQYQQEGEGEGEGYHTTS